MKTYTTEQYNLDAASLKEKYSAVIDNVWADSELVEVESDAFVREVSQFRVYFDLEKIEEATNVDEFDIIDCYLDIIDNEFVIRAMSDGDTDTITSFLKGI